MPRRLPGHDYLIGCTKRSVPINPELHDTAYLDAGLWDLPCLDFSKVAATYEPEAWEKIRSQWQALGIGAVKIGKCLFYDPVQWGVEQMGEGIKRLMEQLE